MLSGLLASSVERRFLQLFNRFAHISVFFFFWPTPFYRISLNPFSILAAVWQFKALSPYSIHIIYRIVSMTPCAFILLNVMFWIIVMLDDPSMTHLTERRRFSSKVFFGPYTLFLFLQTQLMPKRFKEIWV